MARSVQIILIAAAAAFVSGCTGPVGLIGADKGQCGGKCDYASLGTCDGMYKVYQDRKKIIREYGKECEDED